MTGLAVRVDARSLSDLYRTAKAADGVIQVELRRGVKAAAEPVKLAVQEAAGFSSRIPGAVQTKVSFAARGASVKIVVDPGKAPHAAAINNKGRAGKFRHPVYGHDVWVDQTADPFFDTGTKQGTHPAEQAMLQCMDEIARKMGFH